MKRLIVISAALAALVAGGTLVALVVAPTAAAWDWTNLPAGYSGSSTLWGTCSGGGQWRTVSINGTSMGSTCDSGFQAAVDAYVDSTICTVNPVAGGSRCAPTTSTAGTTTQDLPPVTTTVVITTTTPTTTALTATVTPTTATDSQAPAPAPVDPETHTVTVTTTASPVEQSLQAQIDALAAQLSALTDRVTRLEKAGDASWLAFQQSIANGDDVPTAASIARGTWLNAVNGLGEFAP